MLYSFFLRMIVGPDQGISWLIALDCFLINFITVGIARTIGVLYVELIALYGISREVATTPFSIRVFTTNMAGKKPFLFFKIIPLNFFS